MADRNDMFQHLVLAGIWVLILSVFGVKHHKGAINFKTSAITFGDLYGNQSEKAKEYRRENTYGGSI